jgi:amidase
MPEADLSVCGPLARTAEDLELALNIMAGPADREALGWQLSLPAADKKNLKDFRVAIWPTDEMAPVTAETADRATMIGETLSKLGATVSDLARPNIDLYRAQGNYQTLLNSVMTAAMGEDAVAAAQNRADQFDSSDKSMEAIVARSVVLSHRDWIRSNAQREKLRHAWSAFFDEWDILICPQMATAAFPHDHRPMSERSLKVDNEEQDYFQQVFWAGIAVNAYLPSTVFPTGLSREGLPIGLQAVSAPYRDYRTIEFARLISREIGGFVRPGGYD